MRPASHASISRTTLAWRGWPCRVGLVGFDWRQILGQLHVLVGSVAFLVSSLLGWLPSCLASRRAYTPPWLHVSAGPIQGGFFGSYLCLLRLPFLGLVETMWKPE